MNLKDGQAYYIKAYDHCVGIDEAIIIEIVGWVMWQDNVGVTLTAWTLEDEEHRDDNAEPFVILKSAIIKKSVLKGLPLRKYTKKASHPKSRKK